MSLAILLHFLCAQHVSDINTRISIIRSLRLFLLNYHIGRIVLYLMCVGVLVWSGWSAIRVAVSNYDSNLPKSVAQYTRTRSFLPHERVILRRVNKIIILFVTMKKLKPLICVNYSIL